MGSGTVSGVQTPRQAGVIVKDGENLPPIPESLLKLSPKEIQVRVREIRRLQELNAASLFPDLKLEGRLEDYQFVLECAQVVIGRQTRTVERE